MLRDRRYLSMYAIEFMQAMWCTYMRVHECRREYVFVSHRTGEISRDRGMIWPVVPRLAMRNKVLER